MFAAAFATIADPPWLLIPPINLGDASARGRAPDRYVLVEGDGWRLRCDIHDLGVSVYEDAQRWGDLLVIGYGARVYCISLSTHAVKTHTLQWFFSHIHTDGEYCLVTSAQEIMRLRPSGDIQWKADDVGLDGVIVDEIADDVISGRGEWDPPGGWRPFRVKLSTGEIVQKA